MFAFHTNWTRPFFARNGNVPYSIEPFELFTTVLSALSWQALGGSIQLITDACGAAYYRQIGLSSLWDGGIHPTLDDCIPAHVSASTFWAAAKLYALRQVCAPCFMMDTDFILWQSVQMRCDTADVAVIHREEIFPDIYPDASHFHVSPKFHLHDLDWGVKPCNTAFAYFGNPAFKDLYTTKAISFMEEVHDIDEPLTYMVFAEQRLLAMCAAKANRSILALSDVDKLFLSGQRAYTHVWGYKQHMRDNTTARNAFCRRCATRLVRDFPDFATIAANCPPLSEYFVGLPQKTP